MVRDVIAGSPAQKAGVHPRDVILAWNDRDVIDTTDLQLAVAATEIGATAKLTIWRDGERSRSRSKSRSGQSNSDLLRQIGRQRRWRWHVLAVRRGRPR